MTTTHIRRIHKNIYVFFLKKVIQREEKIEEEKPKLKGESPSKKIPQKTTSLFFSASFRNRGNIRDFELLLGRFVLNIFVLCSSQLQILRLESQREEERKMKIEEERSGADAKRDKIGMRVILLAKKN